MSSTQFHMIYLLNLDKFWESNLRWVEHKKKTIALSLSHQEHYLKTGHSNTQASARSNLRKKYFIKYVKKNIWKFFFFGLCVSSIFDPKYWSRQSIWCKRRQLMGVCMKKEEEEEEVKVPPIKTSAMSFILGLLLSIIPLIHLKLSLKYVCHHSKRHYDRNTLIICSICSEF